MSEHRRKPPQPQGGGRAAARRGQAGSSAGRRAAPRGATGSPTDSYGSGSTGAVSEVRSVSTAAVQRPAVLRREVRVAAAAERPNRPEVAGVPPLAGRTGPAGAEAAPPPSQTRSG